MKKFKQVRELNEMDDSQLRKLTALARAGLFDSKKINFIKRALDKDVSKMTPADKKALIELLESLMAEVLGSSQLYSKVKQEVMREYKESANYFSKYDPRFEKNYPTDKELPQIIILKRKAIRVYPDSQKVGLYYSQALDRYVSIPFGTGVATMSEETEINEISRDLAVKTYMARRAQGDENEDDATKAMKSSDTLKRIRKKYGKNVALTAKTAADKETEKVKAAKKEVEDKAASEKQAIQRVKTFDVNPIVGLAALAGAAANPHWRAERRAAKAKEAAASATSKKLPSKLPVVKENAKKSFKAKIDSKRQEKIDEVAPLIPLALGAARVAAPIAGRVLATGGKMLGKGVGAVGRGIGRGVGAVGRGLRNVAIGLATPSGDGDSKGGGSSSEEPQKKILEPMNVGKTEVKTSTAKSGNITTGTTKRDEVSYRKSLQQNENVVKSLRKIMKEGSENSELKIGKDKITINSTIAEKMINLYDSLNEENQYKMEKMLSEGNSESFKKIADFAVRQA